MVIKNKSNGFVFNSFFSFRKKQSQKKRIKVYLSARISSDAHKWNNYVCSFLDARFSVFKPQDYNPTNIPHKELQENVANTDIKAMEEADMGLLVPPYGRDCAWEVGWFAGSKKPLIVFVHKEVSWLRDWMVKSRISAVITDDQETYLKLKKDPILRNKTVILLGEMAELSDAIVAYLQTLE